MGCWSRVGVAGRLVSLWQYFTYRYRLLGDGWWCAAACCSAACARSRSRASTTSPLHQSLLHRLFGVAEVRLESAGGNKPEAQMRVLRLDDALALEALVRRRGTSPGVAGAAPVEQADMSCWRCRRAK